MLTRTRAGWAAADAVARHELRLAWRTRSVAVLGAVLTLLALAAAVVGHARYADDAAQRQRYQALVGQQFSDQPDRHPHRVSHYGYLLFRPRAPLGFFDSGLESFAGTSIFLEAHRQNSANFSAAAQASGAERFGELTVATVLQVFVPLFVFVLAGVAVTRERESGTLPLLLCQGASFAQVLWGKLVGSLLVVAAVVAPAAVVSLGWLAAQAEVEWDADLIARAGLVMLVYAVFLAGCAAIAVTVSAWQSTSRGALVILVGLWFALWIVLPRVLPALATALYPVPARSAFDAEVEARVQELGDSHNPDDPVFARLREETLRRYGVSRVEDLPVNYAGVVMRESERHTASAYEEHRERLQAVYRRQERLVELAGLVSPYLAVRSISAALAGADTSHLFEFERQAEAYRYELIQSLNELHINEVEQALDRYGQVTNGAPSRQRIEAAFFDRLPAFTFARPPVSWTLRQHAVGLVTGTTGLAIVFAALAMAARRRAVTR
jgi:ABC-2 type transport system permease protein